jgi:hypothetical protein
VAQIDPETVKRANAFFPLTASSAAPPAKDADKPAEGAAEPVAGNVPAVEKTAESKTPTEKAGDADNQPTPPGKATAALGELSSEDAETPPGAASSNLPVFGGLAVAAVLLGCAFWAILKGGQQAAG